MENFEELNLNDFGGDPGLSRFIDSLLETEQDPNIEILENFIFGDKERTYNKLNLRTSRQVAKAFSSNDTAVQCENCNVIFTEQEFEQHTCMYDEFQQLNTVPDASETELQKLQRRALEIKKENLAKIRELTQHPPKSDAEATLECSKCCRRFVHANGLYRHWDMHIGELLGLSNPEDYTSCQSVALCVFCGEIFLKDTDAWDHLVSHHVTVDSDLCLEGIDEACATDGNNNDLVENQVEKLPRNLNVNEFIRTINVCKLYQCEYCDSIFSNAKSMILHASNHAPALGFECKACEIRDISLKDILLHRRDECVIFRDVRNALRDFPRVFTCNVCFEEFRGLEQLVEHRHTEIHFFPRLDVRTDELSFMCDRCLETFNTAPEFIDHFNEKHKKKPKNNEVAETSERIPKSAALRRGGSHQTSTRPRQYLCEVCGKSYTQSSHLWQHLRFHQGVKPFECTVAGCNRKFTIRPDLNDHIRKCHTGERPFLCTICGKRFLTGSVYYQHRLIHRGERRYGCEECGKRFYRADALKNHMRIHSGEKPHTCPVCHKTFRQRGDRDKHLKARHPDAEAVNSPKKKRVKSFGRGRIKNNTSLYRSKPEGGLSDEL